MATPLFHSWPIDPTSVFVYCSHVDSDGSFVHGRDGVGRVQQASLRFRCNQGHEAVEIQSSAVPSTTINTVGELLTAMQSDGPMRVNCFEGCGNNVPATAYAKCLGQSLDGRRCKACSFKGECALLPQLFRAQGGQVCDILLSEPEDRLLLRFDPCGHSICVDAFVQSVTTAIEGGMARGQIAASPSTGQYALCCPYRGTDCGNSFVHDFHHYKMCDFHIYSRMKQWAFERIEPTPPLDAPVSLPELADSHASTRAQIQSALTEAVSVQCPVCHVAGQKDGACCHISCPNDGVRYCYYCSRPRNAEATAASCNRQCPMYLTGFTIRNGVQLSTNPQTAVQQYHVWKALRLLKAVLHDVGAAEFNLTVQQTPDILEDFAAHDGLDADGRQEHAPLPGVRIDTRDVAAYIPGELMP